LNEAPVDFTRVATLVFARDDLKDVAALPDFDEVFAEYSRTLVNLGRTEAASEALDRYEATLSGKDARYINLCDMRCYLHWSNGNFPAALRWGSEGVRLRKTSGVDTSFDSAHNLALAQRDAGAVDLALMFFLGGMEVEQVVEPGRLDPDKKEAFYGNIGRCLQLMGQIDPALACYRKSARLAQCGVGSYITENQAYIRQWIGELLQIRGEHEGALAFLIAARSKWEQVSPPRAEQLTHRIEGLFDAAPGRFKRPTSTQWEAYCARWIEA
jgi:tetratricopeptide (TPR) repeat protein